MPVPQKNSLEHLTFAAKLEIGARSQEERVRRKEEEGRSQNKCFYKYEMLPNSLFVEQARCLLLKRVQDVSYT